MGNLSQEALGVNADAIAYAMLTLAYSTEDVNGVPGQPVPGSRSLDLPDEPAGPEGTAGSDGGRQHDHGGRAPDPPHDTGGAPVSRRGGRRSCAWREGGESFAAGRNRSGEQGVELVQGSTNYSPEDPHP